ncbi:hypothetical protein D3C73_1041150 [compost metagenome]
MLFQRLALTIMAWMPAEPMAETAIPSRIRTDGFKALRQASVNTKAAAITPPTMAAAGRANTGNPGHTTSTASAPNPAPEVTPIIEASASGLRTAL